MPSANTGVLIVTYIPKALGISKASNWLFTYAVLQLTPIMPQKIHGRTYYFFGVMHLIIAIIAHWHFPETSGKLLEEVDLIFSGKYNFYGAYVHHPQTAAVALAQIEKVQHHENIYRFPVVALILKAMDAV
ncbi:hypothetical protein [Parasitella parasitica]|uniref:Major facilitator superfamily (MFS) profile domain-containing protein n=1 Tax=Parasitella parasitica TaxID=35722 RepID=A0A0B7N9Y5_9FUNG|nr:hypothetical protein [Parasitella parasitica]